MPWYGAAVRFMDVSDKRFIATHQRIDPVPGCPAYEDLPRSAPMVLGAWLDPLAILSPRLERPIQCFHCPLFRCHRLWPYTLVRRMRMSRGRMLVGCSPPRPVAAGTRKPRTCAGFEDAAGGGRMSNCDYPYATVAVRLLLFFYLNRPGFPGAIQSLLLAALTHHGQPAKRPSSRTGLGPPSSGSRSRTTIRSPESLIATSRGAISGLAGIAGKPEGSVTDAWFRHFRLRPPGVPRR